MTEFTRMCCGEIAGIEIYCSRIIFFQRLRKKTAEDLVLSADGHPRVKYLQESDASISFCRERGVATQALARVEQEKAAEAVAPANARVKRAEAATQTPPESARLLGRGRPCCQRTFFKYKSEHRRSISIRSLLPDAATGAKVVPIKRRAVQ